MADAQCSSDAWPGNHQGFPRCVCGSDPASHTNASSTTPSRGRNDLRASPAVLRGSTTRQDAGLAKPFQWGADMVHQSACPHGAWACCSQARESRPRSLSTAPRVVRVSPEKVTAACGFPTPRCSFPERLPPVGQRLRERAGAVAPRCRSALAASSCRCAVAALLGLQEQPCGGAQLSAGSCRAPPCRGLRSLPGELSSRKLPRRSEARMVVPAGRCPVGRCRVSAALLDSEGVTVLVNGELV